MTLFSIIILALVQGITEFLPISSSGHLILVHAWLDAESSQELFRQNLLMDVAVHVGTLFSVLVYFRADILKMLRGLKESLHGRLDNEGARLNLYVLVGSLPVIAVGFLMNHFQIFWGHALGVIAWTSIIFGVLLWVVDVRKSADMSVNKMTLGHAFLIGLAQATALVPGVSRSGITMTAARFLGYSRTESARYSLLLAIVAIIGAGTLSTFDLIEMGNIDFTYNVLLAALLAFIASWITLVLMMKWLERASFKIFAVYRILMGIALLTMGYFGFTL